MKKKKLKTQPFRVRETRRPPDAPIRKPSDRGIIESYVIRGVTYHITERALVDDRNCSVYRVMKSVGATGWEFIAGRWETPGGARGGILMHLHRPKGEER